MPTTFKNAPLVELIAELRWETPFSTATDQGGNQLQVPRSLLDASEFEEFFQRFGGVIYQHGFKRMERLVPHGVSLPHDRIVCRYSHEDQKNYPVLVQVGPSIFSVNALPPYKSWNEFLPWIKKAVGALLEAYPNLPKLKVSVRYIDAFKEPFLDGRSASEFFDSVLGFSLNIPESITKNKCSEQSVKNSISTTIPLHGMQMTINLAEGKTAGEKAAVMDTLVSISDEVKSEIDQVIISLNNAHKVIHDSFIQLTDNLSEILDPQEEDDV